MTLGFALGFWRAGTLLTDGTLMRRMFTLLIVALLGLGACGGPGSSGGSDGRVQVVVTTGILRDLVANVGGDRVAVAALIPDGADPHTYEPSLRAVRDVVYADVAFSNYLLLEPHAVVRTLDANLRDGVPEVRLAEEAVRYAAEIRPLVEDASLDTIWLGLRVQGSGAAHGADRASEVLVRAVAVEGPGHLLAYVTGAFGRPTFAIDSSDGFNAADGYREDTTTLPPDAHTHMSWAFTDAGVYRLTIEAALAVRPDARPVRMGRQVFTFAVGVNPREVPGMRVEQVLDHGHADLTVDLGQGRLLLAADRHGGGVHTQVAHDAATTVIEVPNAALLEVPPDPVFRRLGGAGEEIHQLPQAVLGRHVHGQIDPHLWQNVRNAIAYTKIIRDRLADVDPAGAAAYRANAQRYIGELESLDAHVRATIGEIPEARRHLVTTHDAFGYLGAAYGVDVSGFVTPNPSTEPSLADRRRLSRTIRSLAIPAVFLEPNLAARSSTLTEVAGELGVRVCPIYGDTFDRTVTTYVQMMRANAASLRDCLAPSAPGAR
jgi:anchored repeat ABC transporter substrate-binding protein